MIKEAVQWNGLEFETEDAEVYSPKPASLFFAETATKLVHQGQHLLDMCTGSGVVGIAVGKFVPDSSVVLSDINDAGALIGEEKRRQEPRGYATRSFKFL